MSSWIAMFIVLSLSACSDKENGGSAPVLGVTPATISFKENKTATVTVDYAGKWEATLSDTSWCALDKSSGEGKGELRISLKPLTSGEPKNSKLTVRAVDHPSATQVIELSLEGMDFYADPIRVEFGYGDNTSYEVDVVCPGGWTATLNDNSWCDIDKASGSGNDKIKITSKFELDASFGNKSAVLTVASLENPSVTATVDIKQFPGFVHEGCITLNKATKGKGIDFVIVGDGFSKTELGMNGHWQKFIEWSRDAMFKFEPLASFRDYFNVYAVTAVSATNVIKKGEVSNTFFGSYFESGSYMSVKYLSKVPGFAYNNSPVAKDKESLKDMVVLLLINDPSYGGMTNMSYGNTNTSTVGMVSLWTGDGRIQPEDAFPPVIGHEFVGHAFGKLADEYSPIGSGNVIPEEDKKIYNQQKADYGCWQNVEFTKNSAQFSNKNWQKLLAQQYPGVGIVEGGFYCDRGVWRSIDNNMMRDQTLYPFFGPVSREILVRKIYELSGRTDYTLDAFIEYDKKNLKN